MAKKHEPLILGIDIGSTYIRALGCIQEEGKRFPSVVASYKKNVEGIERGSITDKEEIIAVIEEAVATITEEVGRDATHTLIALSAVPMSSHHASGHTRVTRGDARVTELDIDNAIKDAHKGVPDIRNKTVIHTIPLKYKLDGNDIVGDVIDTHGNKLEVKTLFVTYPETSMELLKGVLKDAHVRVTDIVAGPVAESVPMLTKKQKIAGVLLLSIGSGVTSLLVYENNTPLLVSTIPVGGDDITKDIALGLKISLQDAEDIKCGKKDTNSKRKLEEIIEARIEDMCIKINKELDRIHRKELLPAGVLVTGGSRLLPNLETMLRRDLRLPITIASTELARISGDTLRDSAWAKSYGLTFLAPHESQGEVIKMLLTSFWGNVKRFFSQFLP